MIVTVSRPSGIAVHAVSIGELADRHHATPTSQQLDQMEGLDELADPVRSALARTVDAFLALDTATSSRTRAPISKPSRI
jgi:hypothetical protein